MTIKSEENIETSENLTNKKKWFNGVKEFSSVKIEPAQDNTLEVHVSDEVDTKALFGGS